MRDRSRFVAAAVEHELQRRRRDELQRSLETPHPQAEEIAEIGPSEWASSLPASDDDLVDPYAGTPVRWVEGTGFIERSQ